MSTTLYCSLRPPPPLDRFVEHFWYWDSAGPTGSEQAYSYERIMPTGSASLIINLAEDEVREYSPDCATTHRHAGAVIVGARSESAIIDTAEQKTVIGIGFRPGGTWPFFSMASDELQNLHAGLTEVWGAAGRSVRERILLAPTPRARLQTLQTILLERTLRPLTSHPAVTFALDHLHHARQPDSIETLSRRTGFSARRLARLFALEVGLTPKLYSRVVRFNRVLQFACTSERVDWSDVAHDCGYFDQAHFIHDFKAFSGLTPTDYMQRRTPFTHHVKLVEPSG